jgi:hypothetical protein
VPEKDAARFEAVFQRIATSIRLTDAR